jgi:hypothetical protein
MRKHGVCNVGTAIEDYVHVRHVHGQFRTNLPLTMTKKGGVDKMAKWIGSVTWAEVFKDEGGVWSVYRIPGAEPLPVPDVVPGRVPEGIPEEGTLEAVGASTASSSAGPSRAVRATSVPPPAKKLYENRSEQYDERRRAATPPPIGAKVSEGQARRVLTSEPVGESYPNERRRLAAMASKKEYAESDHYLLMWWLLGQRGGMKEECMSEIWSSFFSDKRYFEMMEDHPLVKYQMQVIDRLSPGDPDIDLLMDDPFYSHPTFTEAERPKKKQILH